MKRLGLILLTALLATASVGQAQTANPPGNAKKAKVTICHRTGSGTNAYATITIAKPALKAHLRHPGDIVPAPTSGCPTTPMSPTQGGTILTATLTGAAEAPGPGDPDGTGQATIRLTRGEGRLCYQLTANAVTLPASAAHIHVGAAGIAGGIVVPLSPPDATGASSGCVGVSRALGANILDNPAGYYVNVHTADYPSGAVRGQLG